jgi:hypothetical protein
MTLKILPIYTANEAFSQAARVNTVLALLKANLSEFEFLSLQNQLPDTISEDDLVIYFTHETGGFQEAIKNLSEHQRKSIIAFDFPRDVQPLNFLEESQILGLVTYKAVSNWIDETPNHVYLMGQGYGIYGLKSLFDATVFNEHNAQISSENYCLFSQLTHARFQADLSSDISKYLQIVLNHEPLPNT